MATPVRLGLPVRVGPLLPSIRFRTNQRSDRTAENLCRDTAVRRPLFESIVIMIAATDSKEAVLPRPVMTLPPKRRSKLLREKAAPTEPSPLPNASSPRRPRMKRSGQISVQWLADPNEQLNGVQVSAKS